MKLKTLWCIFSICIVFVLSNISLAQELNLSKDALKLKERLDDVQGFSSTFWQEVSDQKGNVISKAQGELFLKRPDKFLMHTTSPDELALFTKDGNVYFYDEALNQVSVYALKSFAGNPLMLLANSSNVIWDNYIVSRDEERYTLVPRTEQGIKSLTMSFEASKEKNHQGKRLYTLESLTIRMDDGNTNFYRFSSYKFKVDDKSFNFILPKDVEYDQEL